MAKNLIDESKSILPKFYNNGNWVENPVLRYNGRYVENDVVEFLSDFFHFLIESRFLNEFTVVWLNSNMPSVNKAFEVYNAEHDEVEKVNMNTVQSAINYDKKKLEGYFDKDLIFNLMTYPEKHIAKSIETLDLLNRKYFNDKEYKKAVVIKIPSEYISKDLGNADWEQLVETLSVYSSKRIEEIESLNSSVLTKEMAGYYNYLISSKRLNTDEKEKLETIKKILNIV